MSLQLVLQLEMNLLCAWCGRILGNSTICTVSHDSNVWTYQESFCFFPAVFDFHQKADGLHEQNRGSKRWVENERVKMQPYTRAAVVSDINLLCLNFKGFILGFKELAINTEQFFYQPC